MDFDLEERPDGATIFATSVWKHLEAGRIIRKWNKYERYINDELTETEVFDYRERLYDQAEIEADLKANGYGEIRITKAWTRDIPPAERDSLTCLCRRP